jgi:tetratricopeptide (TPR) repeat protein
MCEGQLGNIETSLECHKTACELDPNFKEASLNFAQMHKEAGRAQEAEVEFGRIVTNVTMSRWPPAFTYRAQYFYAVGRPRDALRDILEALSLSPRSKGDAASYALAAVCHQSVGDFHGALKYFDLAIEADADHLCWFQREIAVYYSAVLDEALQWFNADSDVDSWLKDCWCKHISVKEALQLKHVTPPNLTRKKINDLYKTVDTQMNEISDVISEEGKSNISSLLKLTSPLRPLAQLRCQGFLANERQFKMFGLGQCDTCYTKRSAYYLVFFAFPFD